MFSNASRYAANEDGKAGAEECEAEPGARTVLRVDTDGACERDAATIRRDVFSVGEPSSEHAIAKAVIATPRITIAPA